MATITIPDRMKIKLPYGAPDLDVELEPLTDVMSAVIHYGLAQKFGDKITGGKGRAQFGDLKGAALHQAVTDMARQLLSDIIDDGWEIRAGGGGGRKLTDPIDAWVRDEAERAARGQIAKGTAYLDGRKITKALPADVRALRDRLMDDPAWVTLARAAYHPPIEAPAPAIDANPGYEPTEPKPTAAEPEAA